MPVIKHNATAGLTQRAVVLDLGDLQRQADEFVADARRRAARIEEEARAKADELVASGLERGLAEGRERGLAEGREAGRVEAREEALAPLRERFEGVARTWQETLGQWERDRGVMLLAARDDVLAFAFAMGAKITGRAIRRDPVLVQEQVGRALGLLGRASRVVVEVHPEDRPLVEEVLPALTQRLATVEHAELRDDETVSRGGCRVRSGRGVIDATIETQIERIARSLLPIEGDGDGDDDGATGVAETAEPAP